MAWESITGNVLHFFGNVIFLIFIVVVVSYRLLLVSPHFKEHSTFSDFTDCLFQGEIFTGIWEGGYLVRYMAVLCPVPDVGRCYPKGMWWHWFQGQVGALVLESMWWHEFFGMCWVSDFWEMCNGTSSQECMWVSLLEIIISWPHIQGIAIHLRDQDLRCGHPCSSARARG